MVQINSIRLVSITIVIFILISIIYSVVYIKQGYNNDGTTLNWILLGNVTSDAITFRIRLVKPLSGSNNNNNNDNSFQLSLYQVTTSYHSSVTINGGEHAIDVNVYVSSSSSSSDDNNIELFTYNVSSSISTYDSANAIVNVVWDSPDDTIWSIHITGLQSKIKYSYNVGQLPSSSSDGSSVSSSSSQVSYLQGTFITPAPIGERYNFTILTAGCSHTGTNHPIFEHMAKETSSSNDDGDGDIQMMVHLGDLHYGDVSVANMGTRLNAISTSVSTQRQALFYSNLPLVNIWDDHDWLGNDSGNNSNKANTVEVGADEIALQSFQIAFPHYPLAALSSSSTSNTTTTTTASSSSNDTIITPNIVPVSPYHAFTIGTVRFVITDLRSEATKDYMMSQQQRKWFYNELRNAKLYDYIVWISSKPWIGQEEIGDDSWFGHVNERHELSNFITKVIGGGSSTTTNNITAPPRNLLVVSADAHMVAFDDGRNTYYGTTDNDNNTALYSFPILQSGPLDRIGSKKGGAVVYSHGCYSYTSERTNQYSKVSFEFPSSTDSNDTAEPCITIESYRVHNANSKELLLQHRMCGPIFSLAASSLRNSFLRGA